jgi:hypothetical protein
LIFKGTISKDGVTGTLNFESWGRRVWNDAAFALDHFPAKLLKLAEGFRTVTGQLLAAQRHETVVSFYSGLLAEVG